MTPQPSQHAIEIFIEVFDKLDEFEAISRLNRGHGALKGPFPVPEVVEVIDWLRSLYPTERE